VKTCTKSRAAKINRTPNWLTEDDYRWIEWHHRQAKRVEALTGTLHHVDHIIPLQSENVSGLHAPSNLQVIPAMENLIKSNSFNSNNGGSCFGYTRST